MASFSYPGILDWWTGLISFNTWELILVASSLFSDFTTIPWSALILSFVNTFEERSCSAFGTINAEGLGNTKELGSERDDVNVYITCL